MESSASPELVALTAPPAFYFPLHAGAHEPRVGLERLGSDHGNGARDAQCFQFDHLWQSYRQAKLQARAERLSKYVAADPALSEPVRQAFIAWWLERLSREHPDLFTRTVEAGPQRLDCRATGESLHFDRHLRLVGVETTGPQVQPAYVSALDALACQVQEDMALVAPVAPGDHRLQALHLCFPNHWSAEEKLGGDFISVHEPVPGMKRINRRTSELVQTMIRHGPFVRFAWGLATDPRLNHHPDPPTGALVDRWHGRSFDPKRPRLYLRVERQVIWGLPAVGGFVFTIRTYLYDTRGLDSGQRRRIAETLDSMDEATRRYKGFGGQADTLATWLRTAGPDPRS